MTAWADHGAGGNGEPLAIVLRPGNAGSNTAADHIEAARLAVAQRGAKDTRLRNLPLKGFAQNQLWCEIVALACELLAWTQILPLAGAARLWEPKRLRLFAVAGRLVSSGRRLRLRLAERRPWAADVTAAAARLQAIPTG